MLTPELRKDLLNAQKNEITEFHIYEKLSQSMKDSHNKTILKQISRDELKHYNILKKHTSQDVRQNRLKVWIFIFISKIFGITFGIKLMEKGEENAQIIYDKLSKFVKDVVNISHDEYEHEKELVSLIDENRLKYISSMVRGVNDALISTAGALAGFTLAFQNSNLIAMAGFITGITAALSIAASDYLATKTGESIQNPLLSSFYTSLAYILTVLFLILPYIVFFDIYLSLGIMILNSIIVISVITYYISIVQEIPLRKRFVEMAVISLGIAALAFMIGFFIQVSFNIQM
jgi:VIT1/CCC1 family predicted Fe2+/Mn2+ transporter